MALSREDMIANYPIPTYRYLVTSDDDWMAFSGVSGLEISGLEGSGQQSALNISLKRGVVPGQSQLCDWLNLFVRNQIDKRDISISLTDDAGSQRLVTWKLFNVVPTNLSAPNFDASSKEVAIEELSLLVERVAVEFH